MKINTHLHAISTKFLYCIALLLCSADVLMAQTVNEWTWVSGDTLSGAAYLPVYGTKGVAAVANKPGGRNSAVSWPSTGNPLWIFGGVGYGATGQADGPDYLGDLWSYNTTTGQWTWVSGSTNTIRSGLQAVYGQRGLPAAANLPGQRYGSATWKDADGNLWMFGGQGYIRGVSAGKLNDLWKFNITTKQWVWIRGDSTADVIGVYGTKGVKAAANKPGGRAFSKGWTDASGNFWLMGGDGIGSVANPVGLLNDLWRYTPADSQWTWISGTKLTNQSGVYGTLNTAAAANIPGGRDNGANWTDASGNFWLMGGFGYNATTTIDYLNDLWLYNVSTGLWTWKGGTNALNAPGVYGVKGVAAAANHPGAREGGTSWTDLNGNFWIMGGLGYGTSSTSGWLNDFWTYNPSTGLWTWVNGDNIISQNGVYGNKNVPAPTNKPGARNGHVNWIDTNGNLWIFGGGAVYITPYQTNVVNGGSFSTLTNDLWGYQLNATIPVMPSFAALPALLVSFSAIPSGDAAELNWQMAPDGSSKNFVVERSPDGAHWQSIGTVAADDQCLAACSYRFTDQHPFSLNYYRLQQASANGPLQYSRVETLNFPPANKLTWYLAGSMAITVRLFRGNHECYRLTGMDGRVWQEGVLQNGQVTFRQLPRGIYIMQVMTTAGIRTEKIVW